MLVEVGKINELPPGGMKAIEVSGKEIVLCNYEGKIFAIDRRCGHMNAPLDKGTSEGYIVTCPMHNAQFDLTTGEILSDPIPRPRPSDFIRWFGMLMSNIKTHNIKTYPVKIDGETIKIEI